MDDNKRSLIESMKRRLQGKPTDIPQDEWDSVIVQATQSVGGVGDAIKGQLLEQAALQAAEVMPGDGKGQMQAIFPVAMHEMVSVLVNPATKDQVRLAAAQYVIDHTIGKPKQEVEHTGSIALEVRAQVKAMILREKEQSIRDVGPETKLDKPKTPVETFLDAYATKNFVVGKKGTGDDKGEA